jgi:flagellin-like hook-associated protein FlgL
MTINPVVGTGIQPQQNATERSAKLRSVVDTFIGTGARVSDDVQTQQTKASRLQAADAGLKQASAGLARASALAQTVSEGAKKIRPELEKLRTAQSGDTKKITDTIDHIASNTTFEGKKVLDGSQKISLEETLTRKSGGTNDITLSVPDHSAKGLGVDKAPTPEKVDQAIKTVDKTVADTQDFTKAADVIAASIDTVAANRHAASSDLQEKDFSSNSPKDVHDNPAVAIAAQSNQLSPALMKLVN